MGEMPIYSEERSTTPRLRVTINDHRCGMRNGHAFNMCGGMSDEEKGGGTGHHGMTIQRRLTRVDSQGDDQLIDEVCLADSKELWQRVANLGKDGVVEEYSEENLWEALGIEQEVKAINGDRSGPARNVHDN